jgi:hypothetical protein
LIAPVQSKFLNHHLLQTHDWTGICKREGEKPAQDCLPSTRPSSSHLSYRRKIQVPLLKIRPRKAVAIDVISKRVDTQLSNEEAILNEPKEVNLVIKKDFSLSANKSSHDYHRYHTYNLKQNYFYSVISSCSKCHLKFSTKEFLDKHSACHAKHFGFTCSECNTFFRKWSSCMAHLWKTHKV